MGSDPAVVGRSGLASRLRPAASAAALAAAAVLAGCGDELGVLGTDYSKASCEQGEGDDGFKRGMAEYMAAEGPENLPLNASDLEVALEDACRGSDDGVRPFEAAMSASIKAAAAKRKRRGATAGDSSRPRGEKLGARPAATAPGRGTGGRPTAGADAPAPEKINR